MKSKLDVSSFYSVVNPRSVALITSETVDGRANAMAATWHTPLSFDPPLYGVSISPKRATHDMVKRAKGYGVNLLPLEMVRSIHVCGRTSFSENPDKLAKAGLSVFRGPVLGLPLIKEAYACLEVRVVKEVEVGDHTLFVGEVVSVLAEDVYSRGLLDLGRVRPSLYRGKDRYLTVDPGSEVYGLD